MKRFFLLFSYFLIALPYCTQNAVLDSLTAAIRPQVNDSSQAILHNDIAHEFVKLSLYDEAKSHYQKVLTISQATNFKKGIWSYWSGMATILLNENKLNEALVSYSQLEQQMQEDHADSSSLGVLYASIANVHDALSNYNKAVEYNNKALTIFKDNNPPYEAIILGNLGSIYFKNDDYQNAIKHHEQSLAIKKVHSSDHSIGTGLLNYAQVYDRTKNYPKAIAILQESILYLERCNDQAGLALCYTSLGLCYVSLSDSTYNDSILLNNTNNDQLLTPKELLAKAYEYEEKAISIFEKMGENFQIGHAYNGIGTVLVNQNKPKEAIAYYLLSYNQFKDSKLETAKAAAEGLAEAYKDLKQYQLAYQWLQKMHHIQDTIDQQTNAIELGRQQANMIYQQEKEIADLKHKQELSRAQLLFIQEKNLLKTQRDNRNKWILILILLFLFTFISFYFIRKNLRTRNMLLETEQQQTVLLSTIEGEEQERERIALELHDGVASAITGLRLKVTTGTVEPSELEQQLTAINTEIRTISHQLAPPPTKDFINVESFFERLISEAFSKHEISLTCYPENDIFTIENQAITNLYRVIQELFQNITKHAQANAVSISYSREQNELNIIIEDNGIGFDSAITKKGIGFENIKKRLLPLNGQLTIDTALGRGTCIIIQINNL
ncbi:MAG: tetratricopeptide repeat protein [Flavobacteriales bacterium]|jgi:signal transduction histidine kinase|nr:tetratricopeptide repeat protein [Flavobacteriales bacterium]